jgi:hypothetical protein
MFLLGIGPIGFWRVDDRKLSPVLSTAYQNLKEDWRQKGEGIAMKKVVIG